MTAYDESGKEDKDNAASPDLHPLSLADMSRKLSQHRQELGSDDFVPIVVPAERDDGEAVDISVTSADDGEDVTMHARVAESSSGGGLSAPASAGHSTWTTPARCMRAVIPGAQAWLVRFVPATSAPQAQQSTPLSPSSSSGAPLSPPTRSLSASTAPFASTEPEAPAHAPLTEQDLIAALPHPNALFHPESMQWQVVLAEEEFKSLYTASEPWRYIENGPAPLWRLQASIDGQCIEGVKPILSVPQLEAGRSAPAWEHVVHFDRWASTCGGIVYSSVAGQLRSVIPAAHLAGFKLERLTNPRPGSTGTTQFQEAATTLIRIVGNAANGEGRAMKASGKTLSNKLGLDQHTDLIFLALGFQCKDQLISPPDMTSGIWQLRMRRAWIELVLWYEYERSRLRGAGVIMSEVGSNVPFYPRQQGCEELASRLFGFRQEQEDQALKQAASSNVVVALESIGTDAGPSDELLEYTYRFNSIYRSMAEQMALFTALNVAIEAQRKESDTMQTLLAMERSKGLFTTKELLQAYDKVIAVDMNSFEETLNVDETLIADMFRTAIKEAAADPAKVQNLKDAISLISTSRGKPMQLEDALNSDITMDIDKAYEILEVQHDTDDDFITAAYQLAKTESRFAAEQCTEALRVIGETRKSDVLIKLYRRTTGKEDEDLMLELADGKKPAGLNNIGNTCYLNSVLQYFYAIRPLRERVLEAGRAASMEEAGKAPVDASMLRVGGRRVTQREVDRSHNFVALLAQLYSAMMTSPLSAVTPERELAYLALVSSRWEEGSEAVVNVDNVAATTTSTTAPVTSTSVSHLTVNPDTTIVDEPQDMTTAMNAEMSAIQTPPLPNMAAPSAGEDKKPAEEAIQAEAVRDQTVVLSAEEKEEEPTNGADVGVRQNSLMTLGAQQDVSECLDNVMFQIEAALTAQIVASVDASAVVAAGSDGNGDGGSDNDDEWVTEEGDLLRRLFLGRTIQRLQRLDEEDGDKGRGRSIHLKREIFKILPVDVKEEGRDIYDGLDGFFDEEILTDSNGQPRLRMVTLTDAPAVMQIQLQRVQFDRTRGAFKSQAHLSMGETLFMDRYMDFDTAANAGDDVRLDKRKQGRVARQQIAALRQRIDMLRPAPITATTTASTASTHSASRSLDRTASFLASLQSLKRPFGTDEPDSSAAVSSAGIPSELLDGALNTFLQTEAKKVDEEIVRAQAEIDRLKAHVEGLWSDERRLEYVLASVFMHRGEASHGHYFLNQRRLGPSSFSPDSGSTASLWFKYNDNVVQDIGLGEVLKDTTGATPYLLSYVRKDLQDSFSLFDTVCRQIDTDVPLPQQTLSDVKMSDSPVPPPLEAGENQEQPPPTYSGV